MKRAIKIITKILAGFAGFISILILIYINFIYIDDSKMDFGSEQGNPSQAYSAPDRKPLSKETLFGGNLAFDFSLSPDQYKEKVGAINNPFLGNLVAFSTRFTNPYQIYVSLGQYPFSLEGTDCIFIPPGEKLTVVPASRGDLQITFQAATPPNTNSKPADQENTNISQLSVSRGDSSFAAFELRPHTIKPASSWDLKVGKFLSPSGYFPSGIWKSQALAMQSYAGEPISLSCTSGQGCFVSDIKVASKSSAEKPSPPNHIIIVIDALRADMGNPALRAKYWEETLKPIQQQGSHEIIDFTNTYSVSNMTSPAVNSNFTCQLPYRNEGISFAYFVEDQKRKEFYDKGSLSWPHRFRENGYQTAMIGNISLFSEVNNAGVNHGFQTNLCSDVEGYDTPFIFHQATQWLSQNHHNPFLLYVHFGAPHGPYKPPLQDIKAAWQELNADGKPALNPKSIVSLMYQGEIIYALRYLKSLLKFLVDSKIAEHSIIQITADHGELTTDRNFNDEVSGDSTTGTLFDHGHTLHEDELRVPNIWVVPNQIYRQNIALREWDKNLSARNVSSLSMGPSHLQLAGLENETSCDAETLFNTEGTDTIGFEGFETKGILRADGTKYIRSFAPFKRLIYEGNWSQDKISVFNREQLYDLNSDPEETQDLSIRYSEQFSSARAAYWDFFDIRPRLRITFENASLGSTYNVSFNQNVMINGAPTQSYAINIAKENDELIAFAENRGKDLTLSIESDDPNFKQENIYYTRMLLAMKNPEIDKLPFENSQMDFYSGRASKRIAAPFVVIKKEPEGDKPLRKINVGNAEFEKILKEWGYIDEE